MRTTAEFLLAGLAALCIGGCAGVSVGPSPEARAALAPTGKLRVAFFAGPIYAVKDPVSGELKGVAVDLGTDLAWRIGAPFEPVLYTGVAALIGGAKAGEWDVALTGVDPGRAAVMDFTAPYMQIEQGYLVRAGVAITAVSEVDAAGTRVGVLDKSSADGLLSTTLKHATLVRIASITDLQALLATEKADVIATGKTGLFAAAAKLPGSRVLDGTILVEPIAMAVARGRDAAAVAYVGKFVEEARADGRVKAAIERAGLRGVAVAPAK